MLRFAIVGGSGLVGMSLLEVLYEENLFKNNQITLFVSKKSAGKMILFKGKQFRLVELDEKALNQKFDIVFFSAGGNVSLKWAQRFASQGCFVIDNTNAFRRKKDVPLIVPEINGELITSKTKLIANPNCSTIELVLVLNRLRMLSKLKKVIVSTYQSVSGAGRRALCDLQNQTSVVFEKGINNNIIAQIGDILFSGYTLEEDKLMFETSKILGEQVELYATAVRVPISICHGESVYVEFDDEVDIKNVQEVLNVEYIKSSQSDLFYPTDITSTNETYVFRIRKASKKEIQFYILADNLRRGASYNAVKIAELIIKQNIIL